MNALDNFLFGYYPYICLTVFLLGSLIRFDRDQYTWKSDSSQLLRAGQLRWGSNLFHIGVLFLFFGHFVGMLTPHFVYEHFVSAGTKQLGAMVAGGVAGVLGFIGVSLLLHRRLSDPRIRINSRTSDIVLLVLLWLQLALGLATLPLSAQHLDGSMMMKLAEWSQRIVTFRAGAPELLAGSRLDLQGAHVPGHEHFPDLPVHPAGACVERLWHGGLSGAPAPGGSCPAPECPGRSQPAPLRRGRLRSQHGRYDDHTDRLRSRQWRGFAVSRWPC
jgi:nitrate reductase gamma subunit